MNDETTGGPATENLTVLDEFAARIAASIMINAKIPKYMDDIALPMIARFSYKAAKALMIARSEQQ